jgi:hypothetical protein
MIVGISIDQGTIAAASIEITKNMDIDNFQFGGLQSLIYVGLLIGKYSFLLHFYTMSRPDSVSIGVQENI